MREPTKQGKVLIELLRDRPHKRIAEIGVSGGETAGHLLRNLPGIERYYAIDPWLATPQFAASMSGKQWALQKTFDQHLQMFLKEMAPHWKRVWPLRVASFEASLLFSMYSLDAVFIDANKLELAHDLRFWRPKVKHGGILAGHDYNARPEWPVAAILERFFSDGPPVHTEPDYVWWVEIA